jgi:hypothetical protein
MTERYIRLIRRNGGARVDTHASEMDNVVPPSPGQYCCDQKCADQGRTNCAIPRPAKKQSRAVDAIYWVVGVALLSALIFAFVAPLQTDRIVASLLGLG